MNFLETYADAKIISTNGEIYIPPDYHGETKIIMPDAQVEYCASVFGLTNRIHGLDPMCGVGTIPRVINKLGGVCFGCERDPERYEAAKKANVADAIFKGDYRNIPFKEIRFDYIFTSMPFFWFKNPETTSNLSPEFALDFKDLLNEGGFLLLDSMPVVERDGEVWSVAEMQVNYFQDNRFTLDKIIAFDNEAHLDTSGKSVVMKFILT